MRRLILTGDRSHTTRALITNLLLSNSIKGIAEIVDGLVYRTSLLRVFRDLSTFYNSERALIRLCLAPVSKYTKELGDEHADGGGYTYS
jgi:hypothetical protein